MENTEHLLDEPEIKLVPANFGKRLANYIIDLVIFSLFASIVLVLAAPYNSLAGKIMSKQPIDFTDQLLISFFYGLYMSVMEAVLKGKTIAKYITGTKVVTQSGMPIDAQTAFVRGLIRIVPLEQLSGISLTSYPYPWHDRLSKTLVIDEAKSSLPQVL